MQNLRNRVSKFINTRSAVVAAAMLTCSAAYGDTLVQWNFNAENTAATTTAANFGFNLFGPIGGVTATYAAGSASGIPSSDPLGISASNRAYNSTFYPAQGTLNKTGGVELDFDTTAFSLTTFTFDWRTSSTPSRYLRVQYNLDNRAGTWVDATSVVADAGITSAGSGFMNLISTNLGAISGTSNNAHLGIRVVSEFAPSTSVYTAAQSSPADGVYSPNGTLRFDMFTLSGSYTGTAFGASSLTWNTTSGNWDTIAGNKPWNKPGPVAAAFTQGSNQGDNVLFNDPAANSVVTIQAGDVTPNSTTVVNNNTLTFTGGSITGLGTFFKSGTGRLILVAPNQFNGAATVTAGIVETRGNNGLGVGTLHIGNATWNATTNNQVRTGLVDLTGPTTIQNDVNLSLPTGFTGSGVLTKTGAGTMIVDGIGNSTGAININGGTVRTDNAGALGGNAAGGIAAPVINVSNATLSTRGIGTSFSALARLSSNINLNNGALIREQRFASAAPSTENGDSEYTSYGTSTFLGGVINASGNSSIRNFETHTLDIIGNSGTNTFIVQMPINITTNSTLTVEAVNGVGTLTNTDVSIRSDGTLNVNDTITINPGATLQMVGAGEKRLGTGTTGKSVIGLGGVGGGGESVFKSDGRTYLTDLATGSLTNSNFVVAGVGTAGLRIEAPMFADYVSATFTAGLLGANVGASSATFGSPYTILNPKRLNALDGFTNGPTTTVDGSSFTRGGTMTVAATDAAGATGTIDNGPTALSAIRLGLDNTATSGALVYQIDPVANSGRVKNYAGLVLKKTGSNTVTTRLLNDLDISGSTQSFEQLGGKLDLNTHILFAGVATLSAGTITGGGILNAPTIVKTTSGVSTVGPAVLFDTAALTVNQGTLVVATDGTDASTSYFGSLTITSGAMDLTNNSMVLYNSNYALLSGYVRNARHGGAWDQTGLTTSTALLDPLVNKSLGILTGAEYHTLSGSPTVFDGYTVNPTDLLVKFTYLGDANFNGQVDGGDYARIDNTFGNESSFGNIGGWINGDFDYNGKVDGADYALIDAAFSSQSGVLARALSFADGSDRSITTMTGPALQRVLADFNEFGEPYATAMVMSVPEPTTIGLAAMALAGLVLPRRRRR